MSDLKKVHNALTSEYLTVKSISELSTVSKYKVQEKLNLLFEAGKIDRQKKRNGSSKRMALHYKLIKIDQVKTLLSQKWLIN